MEPTTETVPSTVEIRNVSGRGREIAATGQLVAAGDAVTVSAELAESLLEQPANWKRKRVATTTARTSTTTRRRAPRGVDPQTKKPATTGAQEG